MAKIWKNFFAKEAETTTPDPVVEASSKTIETTTKSLSRLDALEKKIEDLSKNINSKKLDMGTFEDDIKTLKEVINKLNINIKEKTASKGFDNTKQTYVPFNEIEALNAIKAKLIFDESTNSYVKVADVKVKKAESATFAAEAGKVKMAEAAGTATKAGEAAHATFAEKAGIASGLEENVLVPISNQSKKVLFEDKYEFMENILEKYISKQTIKKLLNDADTFSEFKKLLGDL